MSLTEKNLSIGVHGQEEMSVGVYNMLSSFTKGLHDSLRKKLENSAYVHEFQKNNSLPLISVGFNIIGHKGWDFILEQGGINIMWNVDSTFYKNFPLIKKHHKNPNFYMISLSEDDNEAIKKFLPELNSFCMPLAIDPGTWYSDNTEKTRDVVFLASIHEDETETIAQAKKDLPENFFKLFLLLYEYSLEHPYKNFWEIFNYFARQFNFPVENTDLYAYMFNKIAYTSSYRKRIDLVKKLSDFNLEVYGMGPWEKHISGRVKYMGEANCQEAIKIIKEAKIAINLQPMQMRNGIHDRIMNASAANTMVFTDKNKQISRSYGESVCYMDSVDFCGIEDSIDYYLKNEDERVLKAKRAQEITMANHTWDNRVEKLLSILVVN